MGDWYCMKVGWLMAVLVSTCTTCAFAQQQDKTNRIVAGTNAVQVPSKGVAGFQLTGPAGGNAAEHVVVKNKIRVSGPLVAPAKAKGIGDFSKKVANLFNPLSKEELPQAEPSGPVSTRAWSTIAGWTPGQSAFQTETHHDIPGLRLVSFSVEKQP